MIVAATAGNAPAEGERRAATPLAGAVAGLPFALLFIISMSLIAGSLAEPADDLGQRLASGGGPFKVALGLLPFAGLSFLWFIAVACERLGRFEDQFFSTVVLGSGLLFLAMAFSAAATAGTLVAACEVSPAFAGSSTCLFARLLIACLRRSSRPVAQE